MYTWATMPDEMWVWSLGREDPLEKKVATHSSIPAFEIPWTEEPGGQQSVGSQRVRHDWAYIKKYVWQAIFEIQWSFESSDSFRTTYKQNFPLQAALFGKHETVSNWILHYVLLL